MKRSLGSLALLACLTVLGSTTADAAEIWVGSYFQNKITRLDASTGADLGSMSGVNSPLGMAKRGNKVYATSEVPNLIRTFDAKTGADLGTFAATGLDGPTAITFDAVGRAYVANFNDNSVSRYSATGEYLGRFVTPGSGGLNGPDLGMAFGPDGNLYIPSYYNHKVAKYDGQTGAYLGDIVTAGLGGLTQPRQLLWKGSDLLVSSDSGNKVLKYDAATGAYKGALISSGSGGLFGATGMTFLGESLYVASSRNGKILKYNGTSGVFEGVYASGLGSPVSLQVVPEPMTLMGAALGFGMLCRRTRSK